MTNYFLFILLILTMACSHKKKKEAPPFVAFTHVRIIDGSGMAPLEDGTLIIKDDLITDVGPGTLTIPSDALIIDLSGKTIMPGLVSNHNHLGVVMDQSSSPANYNRENIQNQLNQFERYGVTTITSLGMNSDLIYEMKRERKGGADIMAADRGIGVYAGAPPLPPEFSELQVTRPRNPEEARSIVREMKERDTDLIKLWVDDFLGTLPKMKPEIYLAVIDEAHRHGIRVAAHVYSLQDAQKLAQAKVDILAHGIRNKDVTPAFIQVMKKNAVTYIATLELDESFYIYAEKPEWLQDRFLTRALGPETLAKFQDETYRKGLLKDPKLSLRKKALKTNQRNVKKLYKAGVRIGFGTDSGANPLRIQGFAEHRELELLVESGLTPRQVIQIATSGSAGVLDLTDRGVLARGKSADLLIINGNPDQNILDTRKIEAVWHHGKEVSKGFFTQN
jgi:imidazolonepropionase-like amidohydrolase